MVSLIPARLKVDAFVIALKRVKPTFVGLSRQKASFFENIEDLALVRRSRASNVSTLRVRICSSVVNSI